MLSSPMFDVADWVMKLEAFGNRTPIGRVYLFYLLFIERLWTIHRSRGYSQSSVTIAEQ